MGQPSMNIVQHSARARKVGFVFGSSSSSGCAECWIDMAHTPRVASAGLQVKVAAASFAEPKLSEAEPKLCEVYGAGTLLVLTLVVVLTLLLPHTTGTGTGTGTLYGSTSRIPRALAAILT